jgi:hypothetical protein
MRVNHHVDEQEAVDQIHCHSMSSKNDMLEIVQSQTKRTPSRVPMHKQNKQECTEDGQNKKNASKPMLATVSNIKLGNINSSDNDY